MSPTRPRRHPSARYTRARRVTAADSAEIPDLPGGARLPSTNYLSIRV